MNSKEIKNITTASSALRTIENRRNCFSFWFAEFEASEPQLWNTDGRGKKISCTYFDLKKKRVKRNIGWNDQKCRCQGSNTRTLHSKTIAITIGLILHVAILSYLSLLYICTCTVQICIRSESHVYELFMNTRLHRGHIGLVLCVKAL